MSLSTHVLNTTTGLPAAGVGRCRYRIVRHGRGVRNQDAVHRDLERNPCLIIGVSIALAMLPTAFEGIYANLPTELEMILDSGITVGAVAVILLNLLLNREGNGYLAEPVATEADSGADSGRDAAEAELVAGLDAVQTVEVEDVTAPEGATASVAVSGPRV